jgi:hypothetical protein
MALRKSPLLAHVSGADVRFIFYFFFSFLCIFSSASRRFSLTCMAVLGADVK